MHGPMNVKLNGNKLHHIANDLCMNQLKSFHACWLRNCCNSVVQHFVQQKENVYIKQCPVCGIKVDIL